MERKRLSPEALKPPRSGEKRGPKTGYKPEFARIAKILSAGGATDQELADAFDVSRWTIWNWGTKYPEFFAAVQEGKYDIFSTRVERSLAHRAIGYTVDAEEVKVTKDGDIVRYKVRKHFPPDVTACIFWLKNRMPEQWRDVLDHRLTGKLDLDSHTPEELRKEIVQDLAQLGLQKEQLIELTAGVVPNSKGNGLKH